jgi:hypothetical protein
MLESAKNASIQEAFESKGKEALVEQSPAVSTTDVMSSTVGVGATAASTAEKAGTSNARTVGGGQDDLCMADAQPTLDPLDGEAGGANIRGDDRQCLYVGTLWENDVITDRRDIDEFKEASRMIGRTLVVMIRVLMLQSLSLIPAIL